MYSNYICGQRSAQWKWSVQKHTGDRQPSPCLHSIGCPFPVTTSHKSRYCICTLLYFAQQMWKFFTIDHVFKVLGWWVVFVPPAAAVCLYPLESQVCLWRPLSTVRLRLLSLCVVKDFLSFRSVTVVR